MALRPVALAVSALVLALAACGDPGPSERAGGGPVEGPAGSEAPATAGGDPAPAAPSGPGSVGTLPATLDGVTTVPAGPTPTTLSIPAIDVEAPVLPVGVQPDGGMEVPSASDIGWYRFGPSPGSDGSSVLAAHVDYDGRRGAFFRLGELAAGDTFVVGDDTGSEQVFVVDEVVQVAKADLATSGVFDRTGPARVALVTCGGEFDEDRRSYRDNVVVLASPAR